MRAAPFYGRGGGKRQRNVGAALLDVLTTNGDMLTRVANAPARIAAPAAGGVLSVAAGGLWGTSVPGAANEILRSTAGDKSAFATLSAIIDAAIGSTRGSVLYRGAAAWSKLDPGAEGTVLTSGGAGADPSYQAAAGGGSYAIVGNAQRDTVAAGATEYIGPGLAGFDANFSLREFIAPKAGTARNFYMRIVGAAAGADDTQEVELFVNEVGFGPIFLWIDEASGTKVNAALTVAIAAGDRVAILLRNNATNRPSPQIEGWGFEIEA